MKVCMKKKKEINEKQDIKLYNEKNMKMRIEPKNV